MGFCSKQSSASASASTLGTAASVPGASQLFRWQVITLITIYMGSLALAFSRWSVFTAIPPMLNDTSTGLAQSDPPILYGVSNLVYALSSFAAGPIVDRVGGRLAYLSTSLAAGLLTVSFALARVFPLWVLIFSAIRLMNSCFSPSVAKSVSAWFPPTQYARVMSLIGSGSRVGASLAAIGLGAIMLKLSIAWQLIVFGAGCFVTAVLVISIFVLRTSPQAAGVPPALVTWGSAAAAAAMAAPAAPGTDESDRERLLNTADGDDAAELAAVTGAKAADDPDMNALAFSRLQRDPHQHRQQQGSGCWHRVVAFFTEDEDAAATQPVALRVTLRRCAGSARFWLLSVATFCINALFEFDVMVGIYMTNVIGTEPALGSIIAGVYPVGMLIAMKGGGLIMDRLGRGRDGYVVLLSLCITLLTFAVLWPLTVTGTATFAVTVVLSALNGFGMGLPQSVPQNLFALRFGGPHECGTISSLLECIGFISSVSFNFFSAIVLGHDYRTAGWSTLFLIFTVTNIVGLVFFAGFCWIELRVVRRAAGWRLRRSRELGDAAMTDAADSAATAAGDAIEHWPREKDGSVPNAVPGVPTALGPLPVDHRSAGRTA